MGTDPAEKDQVIKHRSIKAKQLGVVTGRLLGCLPNNEDSFRQPLSLMQTVAQQ